MESRRVDVCFSEDDFFGRLVEDDFFLFSKLAIKLASRNSRSFSVTGFLAATFLPVGLVYLADDRLSFAVFFAVLFLSKRKFREGICFWIEIF